MLETILKEIIDTDRYKWDAVDNSPSSNVTTDISNASIEHAMNVLQERNKVDIDDRVSYIIIAPPEQAKAAYALAEYYKAKGYQVRVVVRGELDSLEHYMVIVMPKRLKKIA